MPEDKKIILHLCADIGSDSHYFDLDPDFEVIKIGAEIGVENYTVSQPIYGIIANPPCTDFSTACGFDKKRDLTNAMQLVSHCQRIIEEAKAFCALKFAIIENPANGRLKDILGKPDFVYQPYEFGDCWTKKTAIWGMFNKVDKTHTWQTCPKLEGLYTRPGRTKPALAFMHKSALNTLIAQRPERAWLKDKIHTDADFRSICSPGFARQFYIANK